MTLKMIVRAKVHRRFDNTHSYHTILFTEEDIKKMSQDYFSDTMINEYCVDDIDSVKIIEN